MSLTPMKTTHRKSVLMLPFVLLLAAASSAAGLQPYTATYEVARNGGTLGTATLALRQAPGGWDFDLSTHSTSLQARIVGFDLNEHSTVRDSNGMLETSSYRYRQSTIASSRERSIDVDASAGRIVTHDKHGDHEFPMQPGVLDRQAVILAISRDLAEGKRGTLSYYVADNTHVATERYEASERETLHVPAGEQRTIKVARVRDSGGGRSTTYWFGLDNGFLPVRILQVEPKGDVEEFSLLSLRR